MAESIAVSVMNTLPRHITGKGKAPLVRAVKMATRPSLAKNFFTPIPRHTRGQMPAEQPMDSVLDYRAWAYPISKQFLWSEDGSMRSLLLAELLPVPTQPAGRRVRKTSQSSRIRSRKISSLSCPVDRSTFSTSASLQTSLKPRPHIPLAHQTTSEVELKPSLAKFQDYLQSRAKSKRDLESLQALYETTKDEGAFSSLAPHETLQLANDLANFIDHLCADQVFPEIIKDWGLRMQELLESLPSGSTSAPHDDPFKESLFSRASSYIGDFYKAEEILRKLPPESKKRWSDDLDPYQSAFLSYILSFSRHEDLYHSLHYAFVLRQHYHSSISSNTLFRNMISQSLSILDVFPLASKWNNSAYNRMVNEMILSCNYCKAFDKSLEIIEHQISKSMDVASNLMLRTSQGLALAGNIEGAQRLFDIVPPMETPSYNRVKLVLKSRGGDHVAAESLVAERVGTTASDREISDVLYPLAERGLTKEVEAAFDRYFPIGPHGQRTRKPNIYHYTIFVQAHARKGDVHGIGALLEDMRLCEVEPNIELMTNIISIYRKKGDVVGALNTYQYMRKIGLSLDCVVYTVIIALLASVKDSESATQVYMHAIEDGLIPDDRMTNALMNAYVETGTLKEAVAIFHHLTSLDADLLPPIDTFNTILKGYVLVGAPFRLISKLFFKLQKIGAKPNTYTFSTLVLSATDAGELDIAHGIYEEMKTLENDGQANLISEHVLTILMSAYLNRRKMEKAKEILDEMTERGHPPTPVTYRAIIASYGGRAHWEENMQVAEEFVKKVQLEEYADKNYQKRPSLVHFYGPLIIQYCNKGNITEVERLYSDYLDAGGEPTIVLLEHLLRCYCHTNDVTNVMAVWQIIRELAESETIEDGLKPGKPMETPFARIHFALSMYLDIMSRSGLHAEVASAWSELQRRGFEFDSHNWNHLIVALVRAGQIEHAFEVVESILLPRGRESLEAFDEIRSKDTSEVGAKLDIVNTIKPPTTEPPLRDRKKRAQITDSDKLLRLRQITLVEDDDAIDADFSYPLQILQIISPQWNTWRPHVVVLRTLLVVVLQMQRGYPIRPIKPGEIFTDNVSGSEMTEQDFDTADTMLQTLYTKYPETSMRVRNFQAKEAQRLSPQKFDKIYLRR
ncbi:hypothetical protein CVT25_015537 [Psilocybe cyanescens]|uniref:Pentacotripeptide-repeat region of PRORP domain-containing protein n=1 Tax=Psilocybe cyanescens TaxID=93625 RepID=A0A409WI50_PSICY|nr:hypothetical protein CVT25_015537 [Psilocybe cyanescens]